MTTRHNHTFCVDNTAAAWHRAAQRQIEETETMTPSAAIIVFVAVFTIALAICIYTDPLP